MTRRIRFDGADGDFLYFSTPSWTRYRPERHDLTVCKRTGVASCTCEDSMYRKRQGNIIPTGKENPCKHVAKLLESFARIISEGIGAAIAA